MSGPFVCVPVEDHALIEAEMERTGLSAGALIEREAGKDPRYIAEVSAAQRGSGTAATWTQVVAKLGLEAVARLCQRLRADQAMFGSLDSIDPLDVQ